MKAINLQKKYPKFWNKIKKDIQDGLYAYQVFNYSFIDRIADNIAFIATNELHKKLTGGAKDAHAAD